MWGFLPDYFLLHEAMPPVRWIGFALVWIALVVLSIDLLRHRGARRASVLPA